MLIKSKIDSETGVRHYVPRDMMNSERDRGKGRRETDKFTPEEVRNRCEESFQQGFQQGERSGFEEGSASVQSQVEALSKVLQQIQAQRNDLLVQSEDFVVEFVFRILNKILGDDAITKSKVDPQALHRIVKEALNEFTSSSRFVIRVHKAVAEVFDTYETQIRETLPGSIELKVITDPSLTPADCLVETDEGVLDARLQSQLDEIHRILKTTPTCHAENTEIQ